MVVPRAILCWRCADLRNAYFLIMSVHDIFIHNFDGPIGQCRSDCEHELRHQWPTRLI